MTGEGEGGEENCHMLITSLLNEGAVIKSVLLKYVTSQGHFLNIVQLMHELQAAEG